MNSWIKRNYQNLVIWFLWVSINELGFFLGKIIAELFTHFIYRAFFPIGDFYPSDFVQFLDFSIYGMIVGFILGVAQWLILRKWNPKIKNWIGISTLGWSIGALVGVIIFNQTRDAGLYGLAFGAIVGVFERFILKRYFNHSYWWILVWCLIGILIIFTYGLRPGETNLKWTVIVGGSIGIITGCAMVILRKHPLKTTA